MAVLLAWLSWREAAPDPKVWQRLRDRAAERTRWAGTEHGGEGWRVYAAQGHPGESTPITTPRPDRIRLLDAFPADAAERVRLQQAPLSDLRSGPPLAGLEIHVSSAGQLDAVDLVRETMGRRTLVYAPLRRGWLVASGEHILLAHPELSQDPDRDFLTAFLTLRSPAHEASAFAAIRTLVAGEHLRLNEHEHHSQRLRLTPDWRWRTLSSDGIVAETGRLLDQATQRCLGEARSIGLSLSSGVDSVAVAAAVRRCRPESPHLQACTYGFDQWPDIDERDSAAGIARCLEWPWAGVAGDRLDSLSSQAPRPVCPDTPISSIYRELKEAVYDQFDRSGTEIWLSGAFGDHLCASAADTLSDALGHPRWNAVGPALWLSLKQPGKRLSRWRRLASRMLARPPQAPGTTDLAPERAAMRTLDARWRAEHDEWLDFPRPKQALTALNGYAMFAASGENWFAQRHGMGTADPYRDPDLSRWLL
ncbi:MAG: hypothetical protein KDI56_14595, partial [Xanthomonadales bacterium]|nr:hypothetical protein [Xanthomonadales bacterium]